MPWMVAIKVGLESLRRNRMRTLLTILGMIIGVAAVISIAALGAGAKRPSRTASPPAAPT